MSRTKVTQILALAGLAPVGKPDSVNHQERCCHTAQNRRGCRTRSRRSPRPSRLLWLACALAATGTTQLPAQTAKEVVIHTFGVPNPADGSFPYGGVLPDREGNLYGTAVFGGTAGDGIVYKIDSTGRETVLYNFTGPDGSGPEAGVIRDSEGTSTGRLPVAARRTRAWSSKSIRPAMRRYCTASLVGTMGNPPTQA